MPYAEAWAIQRQVQEAVIAGEAPSTLLMVEHDPVYTLGRRRNSAENLIDVGQVPVLEVERGGDVTFHGPGQLVVYPILQLEGAWKDLHRVMRALEEAAIQTCADFGISAGRDDRNTGAWVDGKKICAIGIGCRKWVTWHGMALNVCTDLAYFQRIQPCGMNGDLVTSMTQILDSAPSWNRVQIQLLLRLQEVFHDLQENSP
jgi:lipoate-protein ligase B